MQTHKHISYLYKDGILCFQSEPKKNEQKRDIECLKCGARSISYGLATEWIYDSQINLWAARVVCTPSTVPFQLEINVLT